MQWRLRDNKKYKRKLQATEVPPATNGRATHFHQGCKFRVGRHRGTIREREGFLRVFFNIEDKRDLRVEVCRAVFAPTKAGASSVVSFVTTVSNRRGAIVGCASCTFPATIAGLQDCWKMSKQLGDINLPATGIGRLGWNEAADAKRTPP